MARFKLWSLEESAGIDLALGTDAARCGRGSTDIQSCQLVAEGVKMEERIGCQHVRMRLQPRGKLAILLACGVQIRPYLLSPSRWPQAGHAQFGVKARCNLIKSV